MTPDPIGTRQTADQAFDTLFDARAEGRAVEFVNARDMLLIVVVQRDADGRAVLKAEAPNCTREQAAEWLRAVADKWDGVHVVRSAAGQHSRREDGRS